MTSTIKVQNIKHTNDTTAMTIATSGDITMNAKVFNAINHHLKFMEEPILLTLRPSTIVQHFNLQLLSLQLEVLQYLIHSLE